jgi:hypothetical protein
MTTEERSQSGADRDVLVQVSEALHYLLQSRCLTIPELARMLGEGKTSDDSTSLEPDAEEVVQWLARHGLAVRNGELVLPSYAACTMNSLAIMTPHSYLDGGSTPDSLG